MSAYGLARRAGGALAEVPAAVPGNRGAVAQAAANGPGVKSPAGSKGELLLLIPGEAITAFLTVMGAGSFFSGTVQLQANSADLLVAGGSDGSLVGWAWAGLIAGLLVGVVFTVVGLRDAPTKSTPLAKALVTILSTIAFIAIALQTPGNPFALQFGVPLAWGTGAVVIIAAVFIPLLKKLKILS